MPKKTFFKLDAQKQAVIIQESVKVFSEASFNEVKIATIIRQAQIPRTSFYDYFEDKMDLYAYIMLMVSEKKKLYMSEVSFEDNFFDVMTHLFEAGLRFMLEEPELDKLSRKMLSQPELMKEIFGEEAMDVSPIFEDLLLKGIQNGVIRENINISFMARTLMILSRELMIDMKDEQSMVLVLKDMSKELVTFLQHGLKK